jgi:hypothetical protein
MQCQAKIDSIKQIIIALNNLIEQPKKSKPIGFGVNDG